MVLKVKTTRRKSIALDEAMVELKKEETKRLNISIQKSKMKAFKKKALDEDKTMTELILKWVDEYISI